MPKWAGFLLAKVQIFQDSQRDVIEDLQDISAHATIFAPNWKSLTQLLFNYIQFIYLCIYHTRPCSKSTPKPKSHFNRGQLPSVRPCSGKQKNQKLQTPNLRFANISWLWLWPNNATGSSKDSSRRSMYGHSFALDPKVSSNTAYG